VNTCIGADRTLIREEGWEKTFDEPFDSLEASLRNTLRINSVEARLARRASIRRRGRRRRDGNRRRESRGRGATCMKKMVWMGKDKNNGD
jgi:hypothetical protein